MNTLEHDSGLGRWLRRLLLLALLAGSGAAGAAALDVMPGSPEYPTLATGTTAPAVPAAGLDAASATRSDRGFDVVEFAASLYTTVAGGSAPAPADAVNSADSDRSASVPLPAAAWLFASGLGALGYFGRRRLGARRRSGPAGRESALYRLRRHGPDAVMRTRLRQAAATYPPCDAADRRAETGSGGGPLPPQRPCASTVHGAFDQMAQVLAENPDVVVGRKFGRACVKLGKRAFIACDGDALAFRVGTERAAQLHAAIPATSYWNPKQGPKPKHSWLAHPGGDAEALVALVCAAYEHALACAAGPAPSDADETEANPLREARSA